MHPNKSGQTAFRYPDCRGPSGAVEWLWRFGPRRHLARRPHQSNISRRPLGGPRRLSPASGTWSARLGEGRLGRARFFVFVCLFARVPGVPGPQASSWAPGWLVVPRPSVAARLGVGRRFSINSVDYAVRMWSLCVPPAARSIHGAWRCTIDCLAKLSQSDPQTLHNAILVCLMVLPVPGPGVQGRFCNGLGPHRPGDPMHYV